MSSDPPTDTEEGSESTLWSGPLIVAAIVVSAIGTIAGRSLEALDGTWLLAVFGIASACVVILALLELLDKQIISRRRFNVGAATVVVVALVVPIGFLRPWEVIARGAYCGDPVELPVVVPYDGDSHFTDLVGEFADQYTDDGGCSQVAVTTFTAPWLELETAMADGWDENALREHGPPPAVWIAESSTQIAVVAESGSGRPPQMRHQVRIGTSPIVLGVPESFEHFLGGDTDQRYRSDHLMDRYLGLGGTAVVRADPTVSFTGTAMLNALYNFNDDPAFDARSIEMGLAWGLEDGGLTADGDTSLLCRLRQRGAAQPATAVFTTERAILAYNSDRDLGSECPTPQRARDRLLPYYPLTAAGLDYTAVRLTWTDAWGPNTAAVERHHDRAAAALISWLADDEGQQALNGIGVRPEHSQFSPEDDGLTRPGMHVTANPLHPDRYREDLERYYEGRRETRVLLAVDLSGSMNEQAGTGQSRFDIAVEGVDTALRYLKPADRFGLWAFSGSAADPYTVLLDIEASEDPRTRQAEAVERLAAQRPSGGTPLHSTIAAGIEALAAEADDETQSVLVVLTDGNDTEGGADLAAVLQQAQESKTPIHIIAIGEASCTANEIGRTAADSRGSCRQVHLDSLPHTFDALFRQIWGAAPSEGGD